MMLGGGIPDFLFTVSLGSHLVFTEIFMTFLAATPAGLKQVLNGLVQQSLE